MITFLYTVSIYLYIGIIRLASLWNDKARQWIIGRQQIWRQLADFRKTSRDKRSTIWIHCASLGEFEQGRPLIEKFKVRFPDTRLVLTFFSPSGYEVRKDYPVADLVCYLPADTPYNARKFIAALRPDLAIFVKYEFWRHYLYELKRAQAPTLLISAIFRPDQVFFKSYGGWYRRLLGLFQHIFIQDEASGALLRSIEVEHFSLAGDTRVDRVLQLREQAAGFPAVDHFAGSAPVWIAGSTWPPDEALLFPFWAKHLPENWKIIMAPHDIAEEHLLQVEEQCELPLIRYSQLQKHPGQTNDVRVLLIDNIGMLSALYRYGHIAYIGGGFGKAIHNLLEPIAFSLPVIFGPRHEKFQEALALKESGGGFAVETVEELRAVFSELEKDPIYKKASGEAYDYLLRSKGSTAKILHFISEQFPELGNEKK